MSIFNATSDSINRNTMTLVYSGNIVATPESWVEIPFSTPFNYSGTENLVVCFERDTVASANVTFYYTTTSPDYRNVYYYRLSSTASSYSSSRTYYRPNVVFNMCTEVPPCVRPTEIEVLDLVDTSAIITWTGSASNYRYVLSTTSVNPDSVAASQLITVNDDSIFVDMLNANTTYYFYVQAICGDSHSDWSLETSFTTACSPMSLPYTEDFENYGTGAAQAISPCWTKGSSSTTAYPYPYGTNVVNGQRSLYFYSNHPASGTGNYCYAALPMFQDSVKNLSLSFSVRRYNSSTATYTTYLVMGVMTNPNDIATFEPMDTLDLYTATPNSINSYEYYFNNYTGNGKYIAIFAPVPPLNGTSTSCTNYAYVDDVTVDYIPTCPRPNNLTVSSTHQ